MPIEGKVCTITRLHIRRRLMRPCLSQVRSSYAADLQQRTELENLLRGAVEEVVQEVGLNADQTI